MLTDSQFNDFLDSVLGKNKDHDDLIEVKSELKLIHRTIQFGQESIQKSIGLQDGAIKSAHNRLDDFQKLIEKISDQQTNTTRFMIGTVGIGGLGLAATLFKLFFFQ